MRTELDKDIEALQLSIHNIKGSGMLPEEAAAQYEHLTQRLGDLMQIRDMKIGGYTDGVNDDEERVISFCEEAWNKDY